MPIASVHYQLHQLKINKRPVLPYTVCWRSLISWQQEGMGKCIINQPHHKWHSWYFKSQVHATHKECHSFLAQLNMRWCCAIALSMAEQLSYDRLLSTRYPARHPLVCMFFLRSCQKCCLGHCEKCGISASLPLQVLCPSILAWLPIRIWTQDNLWMLNIY